MTNPNHIILYVADIATSQAFYADLLGRQPLESSPGFALFVLNGEVLLGLWRLAAVEPRAEQTGGGAEIAFQVAEDRDVDTMAADWTARGIRILQPPQKMDFGYTFTGADPDGHRLRVYALTPMD